MAIFCLGSKTLSAGVLVGARSLGCSAPLLARLSKVLLLFSFFALFVGSAPAIAAPAASVNKPASEPSESVSAVNKINFTDSGQHRYATHLFDGGDYKGAAREFSRLIENFPFSSFVGSAQLGMARAYFSLGRYTEAERGARLYMKNFPKSKELNSALTLFRRARSARSSPSSVVPVVVPVAVNEKAKQGAKSAALRPESLVIESPIESPTTDTGAIKAVQIPLFLQSDYSDIGIEMARLKASGLDTVIVRVFHNAGDRYYASADPVDGVWNETGVYFKTDHAPIIDDVLGPLVELAHANGLKIFAWMTTRYADYGLEHRDDLACKAYDLKSRSPVRCKGLDFFNEEAVEHLEALYSDLAEYAIDGILFQDDLVLRQTEGFGARAQTLFEAEFGEAPTPERLYISKGPGRSVDYTPLFWRWAAWKNARLLEVASRLKSTVRAKNPEAAFAINLMYESVTNPPYALAWLSQDLVAAVEVGFDYYSIMAYHRQMESELNKRPIAVRGLIGKMVADATRTVKDPSKVLVKLQIVDWKTGESIDDDEVTEILREVLRTEPVSLAVVPYRDDFAYSALSTERSVATKRGMALLERTSAR